MAGKDVCSRTSRRLANLFSRLTWTSRERVAVWHKDFIEVLEMREFVGRTRGLAGIVTGAVVLVLSACAQAPERRSSASPVAGNAVEGRRIAEVYCSTCHAIGPIGESRHPVAPPFRTLSQDYEVNALAEAFAEGILVGHRDMPEFRLEPAQIDNLLVYLNTIQSRQGG